MSLSSICFRLSRGWASTVNVNYPPAPPSLRLKPSFNKLMALPVSLSATALVNTWFWLGSGKQPLPPCFFLTHWTHGPSLHQRSIKNADRLFWNIFLLSRNAELVLLLLDSLCSTQSAGTTGSDQTDLATSRRVPPDGWGLTNMLMVTTTEGMLNRLHEREEAVSDLKEHPFWYKHKWLGIKYSVRTFIATPRTRGQQFLLALYLWYARPAFRMGLSIRPPPATTPVKEPNH